MTVRLVRRGLLLYGGGLLFDTIWDGTILPYYGVMFVLAALLNRPAFGPYLQLIGANRAGPFFHLIPLFGSTLAIVFLGERPGWHHLVGAILIIGGVVVAGRWRPAEEGRNRVSAARRSS